MRTPYYTDEDIEVIISDLENETENSMKEALKAILILLKEKRDNQSKVYKVPTGNKKDIIVGESLPIRGKCNCPICKGDK